MAGKGRAKGLNKQSIILMGTIHIPAPPSCPPLLCITLKSKMELHQKPIETADSSTDYSESASAPRDKGVKTQLKQLL